MYNKIQSHNDVEADANMKRYSNLVNFAKERVREHRRSKLEDNPPPGIIKKSSQKDAQVEGKVGKPKKRPTRDENEEIMQESKK